jgi:hypothetical protein
MMSRACHFAVPKIAAKAWYLAALPAFSSVLIAMCAAPVVGGSGVFPSIPGSAELFPGSGAKIPGSSPTGITRKYLV